MYDIDVALGERSYRVIIGRGVLAETGRHLKESRDPSLVAVVTNPTVWRLYGKRIEESILEQGITYRVIEIPDGEEYKTLASAASIYGSLVKAGATRKDTVVAVGGGVIGDLAGFVAATYMRGVSFVQVPTTLLAQVDSSVGGKVAVDIDEGKNLVGAFHQPDIVITDTDCLSTLPDEQIGEGLAEIIKTAFLAGSDQVKMLEESMDGILMKEPKITARIVADCVRFKADIVSRDERDESDLRAVLNFGHTIGHAIEAAGKYSRFSHGEAIAIGMAAESRLSEKVAGLKKEAVKNLMGFLSKAGLPTAIPSDLSEDALIRAMKADKKRTSEDINVVVLADIGRPEIKEIDEQIVREVLGEMRHG